MTSTVSTTTPAKPVMDALVPLSIRMDIDTAAAGSAAMTLA